MKKQLLALCAALALSIPATLAGKTTLTSAQGLPINGLQAGSTFQVTLRQSDNAARNGVKVTIDERLKPYLEVTLRSGILTLGFQDLPRNLQDASNWLCPATAEVILSRIDRLGASGLSNIKPEGSFSGAAAEIKASGSSRIGPLTIAVTGGDANEVKVSGLSQIESLTLKNARTAEVTASGSSRLAVDCGAVSSLGIEVSGMSNATVKGGAPSTVATVSGSAGLRLDCGAIRSLNITASGMASSSAAGSAESVTAEASGSSHINLKELKAQRVKCETSGMSGITCCPTVSLDASASGSSSVRYRAGGTLRTTLSKSGMGSIVKIE